MKNQTSDITETDNHYKSYLMGATQITDAELTALVNFCLIKNN